MQIHYTRYQESEVLRLIGQFPVVGLLGPRQVGKTTLSKTIQTKLSKPTRYLDLEYPEDWAALQEPVRFLERYENDIIILDEVQRMSELFPVLRALIDRNRIPGRFILLGSASPKLIQRSSETLAGRIAYVELQPFSWSELPSSHLWEEYWLRGGFPESLLCTDEQASLDWRQNFIRSYLERDLPLLGLQADPMLLRRLWTMIAHLNAQLLNKETLSRALGINTLSLNRYLDFFESAYLIRRLQPFFANVGKRLVKTPKLYLRDTGILHSLLNIRDYQQLLSNPIVGASWETLVFNQLLHHLPSGYEIYFYRTHEGAEADFVITSGGEPKILIEVKFSSNPQVSKGFYHVCEDLKTSQNFIIAPIKTPFPTKNGVEVIGIDHIPSMIEGGE